MRGTVSRFIGEGVGFARLVDVSKVSVCGRVDIEQALPENADWVLVNCFVGGNEFQIVMEGLRNQHPVERVAVDEGQAFGKLVNFEFEVKGFVRNCRYYVYKRWLVIIWPPFAFLLIFSPGNYRNVIRFSSS